jgi:hypothetical protein
MARNNRATRDQLAERLEWISTRIAEDPLKPAHLLVAEICERFGVQQRQAYRLRSDAIAKRRQDRPHSAAWHEITEERRHYLLDLRETIEQVAYLAGVEGNRSAQLGALRQLRELDRQLAEVAPTEVFRAQLEHQLAVERMPF